VRNFILEHWNAQAETHGVKHSASWGDIYAINLEIETIDPYIFEGSDVLDAGCANGFSVLQHLDKKPRSITGIDFSPKMIEQAQNNKPKEPTDCEITFKVGDIRNLPFEDETFDVVYTTRTLINLPLWKEQIQGIEHCIRVCKRGGKIIFSEAFWEPLMLLNAFRGLSSLPPLVEHDFNRYIKKSNLEEFLKSKNIEFEVNDFSSVYYLGSRFLRELVTNPADYPGYSNPINKLFYEIEKEFSGGGFGVQQAYIITKT
jgi:ubiquinone/menaquinone biosynthesis C-methylase UbiE